MSKLYVEAYGCSMSQAEAEQVKGHASATGLAIVDSPGDADFVVLHTCAVKQPTEFKMLRRIKALLPLVRSASSKLVVSGCLPKVNANAIMALSDKIVLARQGLEGICRELGIEEKPFSPATSAMPSNQRVVILPVAEGCASNCSFCATKIARGKIRSFPAGDLKARVQAGLLHAKEFWLTGQDTGAYGIDIGSSLPVLVREILSLQGEFRLRIGMMNPQHLARILPELLPLFDDHRLYRFLHVPFQSGSDRVLRLMRRGYNARQFLDIVAKLRKEVPGISVATDVIVGFPTETECDFKETVAVLQETKPDVVNISQFGPRPGTEAALIEGRVKGSAMKARSRALTLLCRAIALERNKLMVGGIECCYFSEEGKKGGFVGRTSNYKAVVSTENLLGRFAKVELTGAHSNYLDCKTTRA